jgi:hypothetical protein
MNRVREVVAAVVAGVLVTVGLSGCGVEVQQEAQSLPSGALPTVAPSPTPVTPSPTPSPTAERATIYFVSGRGLEGVEEPVIDRSAIGVMAALAADPPIDRQTDLRTLLRDPLTGAPMLTVLSESPTGRVVLARTDAFTLLPANDQVLLVGQVVTSMDDVGLDSVVIVDQAGLPIPLALPDGRVLEGPATAADYDALVVQDGP